MEDIEMNIIKKLTNFKADWIDVALIKIAVIAAALLLAKLWSPILSLDWYWYLLVWILTAIRPLNTFYRWIRTSEES
jgi:hypothetical protein